MDVSAKKSVHQIGPKEKAFQIGGAFDPALLSDFEAGQVLESVDNYPGLSRGAKDVYRWLFNQARNGGRYA